MTEITPQADAQRLGAGASCETRESKASWSHTKANVVTNQKLWAGQNQLGRRGADAQQGAEQKEKSKSCEAVYTGSAGNLMSCQSCLSLHVVWQPHLTPTFLVTDWQLRAKLKQIQLDREEKAFQEARSTRMVPGGMRGHRGLLRVGDKNDCHMSGLH